MAKDRRWRTSWASGPDSCTSTFGTRTSWAAAIRLAEDTFGPVGVLVNNAGIVGAGGGVAETSLDDFLAVVAVNQVGPFLGMQAVVPSMRRGHGGSIVNISSNAGLMGYPGAWRTARRSGHSGMTKSAALELAPDIRVNSIHPGPVDTPMIHPEGLNAEDSRRSGRRPCHSGATPSPSRSPASCCSSQSDESSFMTGAELAVDGGRTAGDAKVHAVADIVTASRDSGTEAKPRSCTVAPQANEQERSRLQPK